MSLLQLFDHMGRMGNDMINREVNEGELFGGLILKCLLVPINVFQGS